MKALQRTLAVALTGAFLAACAATAMPVQEEKGPALTPEERKAVFLYREYQDCLDREQAIGKGADRETRIQLSKLSQTICIEELGIKDMDAYVGQMLTIFAKHGVEVMKITGPRPSPAP